VRAYRDEQSNSVEYPQTAEEILYRIKNSPKFKRLYQPSAELAKEIIERFNAVQQRIKDTGGISDIFGYPSYGHLVNAIAEHEKVVRNNKALADAKKNSSGIRNHIIYETDRVLAIRPPTWEMSYAYFGPHRRSILDSKVKEGSKWCTAASAPDGPEMFTQYTTKGDNLVYFVDKTSDSLNAIRVNIKDAYWKGGQTRKDFHRVVEGTLRQLSAQQSFFNRSPKEQLWTLIAHTANYLPIVETKNMTNQDIDFHDIAAKYCDSKEKYLEFVDRVVYIFEGENK
jgi:hypothetical protein